MTGAVAADPTGTEPMPMRVWLGPDAAARATAALTATLAEACLLDAAPLSHDVLPRGPAVLVMTPGDMLGADRQRLRALLRAAAPARPVLWGGTGTRDVLLDAINHWGVLGVVSAGTPGSMLLDAVTKSFEAAATEIALERAERDLLAETERLDRAVKTLDDTRERLLHAERLTTVGRFTHGLTEFMEHQQVRFEAFEAAARQVSDEPELLDLIDQGMSGLHSVGVLLHEISAYAEDREQTYELRELALDPLVTRVVGFTRFDPLRRERNIRLEVGSRATVLVDRQRVDQVLINLLRNACEATQQGGTITIQTSRVDGDAVIEVIDDGCGMVAEVHANIFEPFFTTKGEAGLGLGLGITRATIERHGGHIECDSEPGVGTRFTIVLPAVQTSTTPHRAGDG